MEVERATYSRSKVNEAIKTVKAVKITATRKMYHWCVARDLKEACEKCYELTNCLLFDPEYTPVEDYVRAAFRWKTHTNKDLEYHKRRALRYLTRELEEIVKLMDDGEVNVID